MTARVLINVFSGLPNPRWMLDDATAQHFRALLLALPDVSLPRHDAPDPLQRPRGGYRGVEIAFDDKDPRQPTVLFGGLVLDTDQLRSDPGSPNLAEQIFSTAPFEAKNLLGGLTLAELRDGGGPTRIRGIEGEGGALACRHFPIYSGDTGDWHTFQDDNNCYNYANDALNRDKRVQPALPGPANNQHVTMASLREDLVKDGLECLGMSVPDDCPTQGRDVIAVLLRHHASRAVRDFHCLRLDPSGRWSHKDGGGPVTDVDNDNRTIDSIIDAKLVWNPELVGFYLAATDKRKIK